MHWRYDRKPSYIQQRICRDCVDVSGVEMEATYCHAGASKGSLKENSSVEGNKPKIYLFLFVKEGHKDG
jgi:hypothetical protein